MSSTATTSSNNQPKTAKEVIAANVQSLIEQLEAGHSDALTAYLNAMSRFHNYSLGNILEIARQTPDATRVAGFWKWKELGRSVKKGEKGIRILAPIIGVRRKKDEEAEKDITKQNTAVLVGFRSAYVFDVSQTEGAELPELREISGDVGENRDRLIAFIERQGIELVFTERIAPALGMSYGGRIAILPGQSKAEEFSTLVHELAHEMLHKAERRTATTQDGTRDGGRGHRLCHRQSRRTGNRHGIRRLHPALPRQRITCWPNRSKSSSRPPLSSLPPWNRPQPRRWPMQNWRRWRDADHPSNHQEGRRMAPRPVSQDRQPALHGACHRGDGRVRPDGTCRQSLLLTMANRTAMPCATRRCASSLALPGEPHLSAFYYRNDYVGVEQWSRNIVRGNYVHLIALHEQHQRFAKTWDNNLRLQGFAEAFTDKCIRG